MIATNQVWVVMLDYGSVVLALFLCPLLWNDPAAWQEVNHNEHSLSWKVVEDAGFHSGSALVVAVMKIIILHVTFYTQYATEYLMSLKFWEAARDAFKAAGSVAAAAVGSAPGAAVAPAAAGAASALTVLTKEQFQDDCKQTLEKNGLQFLAQGLVAVGAGMFFTNGETDEKLFSVHNLHALAIQRALDSIWWPTMRYIVFMFVLSILVAVTLCFCSRMAITRCRLYLTLIWCVAVPFLSWDTYAKIILRVDVNDYGKMTTQLRASERVAQVQLWLCCAAILTLFWILAPLATSRIKTLVCCVVLYSSMVMSQPNHDLVHWSRYTAKAMPIFTKLAKTVNDPRPLQSSVFERCVRRGDMTPDKQCLGVLMPCKDNGASWRTVPDLIAESLSVQPTWVPVSGPDGGLCIQGEEDSQKAAEKHKRRWNLKTSGLYAEYYPKGKQLDANDYLVDPATDAIRSMA